MSMLKLESEFRSPAPLVVDQEDTGVGAALLRRILADPARAARTLAASPSWRSDPKGLAAVILPGAPSNGFSVEVAALSPAEWELLHAQITEEAAQNADLKK